MRRLDRGAGTAPLRVRADAVRALGEPREPALRSLRAVREELAGRRNTRIVLRTQARAGASGKCQVAPARTPRWSAGWRTRFAKRVTPRAGEFAQTAQARLRRR